MLPPSRLPPSAASQPQPLGAATIAAPKAPPTSAPSTSAPSTSSPALADPTFAGLPASAVALATTPDELRSLLDSASKAARGSASNLTALATKLTGSLQRVRFDAALVDSSRSFGGTTAARDLGFTLSSPSVLAGVGPATSALLLDELGIKNVRDLANTPPGQLDVLLTPARGGAPIAPAQLEHLRALQAALVSSSYEDTTPALDLASVSKVRARLEATQKTVGTMAGLLETNPVELTDALVRLGATFQWLEGAQQTLASLSDADLAKRVKGPPAAVRAELGQIHLLLDAVLARREAFEDARTTTPADKTHRKAEADATRALLTQPLDSAKTFSVMRLPNLSPKERIVEAEFANAFETKGAWMVREYLANVRSGMYGPPNVIAPDDAKLLSPRYARADLFAGKSVTALDDLDPDSKAKVQRARAETNIPLHMTATAIARLALVQALDELAKDPTIPADKKTLLITCGGVAAGKGYAVKNASDGLASLVKSAALVYDTDGETSGTFNSFVLDACKKRGIHPTFLYVHADPTVAWERVFSRAAKEGRMVSEEPFLDSHVDSPRNFAAFHQAHKDAKTDAGQPVASFFIIDNASGTPQLVDAVPAAALAQDREQLRHVIKQKTNTIADVPAFAIKTAQRGERLWPERYGGG